jgi:dienelactone hydrolase
VALDTATGKVLKEIPLGPVWCGPSVSRGRVFVGTGNILFAVGDPKEAYFPKRTTGTLYSFGLPGEDEVSRLGSGDEGPAEPASYKPPRDIAFRTATVMSEGSRITAELFAPKAKENQPLPTIIMCHGWGGTADLLRPDAVVFARAGYFVVTFDYRGWGASEGRVILTKPIQRGKRGEPFTAEVKEIREVVDPLDQATDLLNVLHWVQGEKQCDTKRIGLWGSSFSGGLVIYAAARDARVKATVSQVPSLDGRWMVRAEAIRKQSLKQATQRARGEIGYPAPGARVIGNLRGAPLPEKFMRYAPVEDVARAPGCAMLFILAEKEELLDNKENGILAHQRAKGPKKLVILPGIKHYDIYRGSREKAQQLAIAWFDVHLKK